VNRVATVLTVCALTLGLGACGDDDEEPASTTATTETTRGYPAAGDEPFTVGATIEEIERVGGSDDPADQDNGFVILSAEATDGKSYRVLVPADVTLDEAGDRVLRDPACAGKVLAKLELVPAPPSEDQGDHVLVSAEIDTENC